MLKFYGPSVREPYNYLQAKQLGCHIITIPPSIIEKIEKFGKSFDQLTKETVKAFLVDSKKSQKVLKFLVAGDV
jgi:transaldolase